MAHENSTIVDRARTLVAAHRDFDYVRDGDLIDGQAPRCTCGRPAVVMIVQDGSRAPFCGESDSL